MKNKAPWLQYYEGIRQSLEYPESTLCKAVFDMAEEIPESDALLYMGRKFSFGKFREKINIARVMLENIGVKAGDKVAVCLPNIPQAVYLLYACDMMGAVVSFLHPLSAVGEFVHFIKELDADFIFALDIHLRKFQEVFKQTGDKKLVLTSAADELGLVKRKVYNFSQRKKLAGLKKSENVYFWSDIFKTAAKSEKAKRYDFYEKSADDTSVVLFSGGTTGEPKGVMLSSKGLNAMAMQTVEMSHCEVKEKIMLAAMPMFHGFGLGVCVHTALMSGACCILVPRFTVSEYAKIIKKYRPNFIAGVPTLFEALLRDGEFDSADLSCLSGVFSGGDSLPVELKKKFDGFLKSHGASVKIREGYGATECVTASCLTPYNVEREGSIGIPFPDTYYKICKTGTTQELPFGEEGEICINGPAIMKGYLNSPEETEKVLKTHEDGFVWLHTGDVGFIDEDGFVYFKSRIKRVIVTRGYNVYPQNIERILEMYPPVDRSCVVGIDDSYKMQSIKAYVVLKPEIEYSEALLEELMNHCRQHIAKYAIPSQIEFLETLPLTKAGKVDYRALESRKS